MADTVKQDAPTSKKKKNPVHSKNCSFCNKTFATRSSLIRHLKNVHKEVEAKLAKPLTFKCSICEKNYGSRKSLRDHLRRKHHNVQVSSTDSISIRHYKFKLRCPECTSELSNRASLREHIVTKHKIQLKEEEQIFVAKKEFDKWKERIQDEDGTIYMRPTAKTRIADTQDAWREYLYCHRSGDFVSHGGRRKLKKTGSVKMGFTCPASMVVTYQGSSIHVKAWRTHMGHNSDPPVTKDTLRRWKKRWPTLDPKRKRKVVAHFGPEILADFSDDNLNDNDSDYILENAENEVEIEACDDVAMISDSELEYFSESDNIFDNTDINQFTDSIERNVLQRQKMMSRIKHLSRLIKVKNFTSYQFKLIMVKLNDCVFMLDNENT